MNYSLSDNQQTDKLVKANKKTEHIICPLEKYSTKLSHEIKSPSKMEVIWVMFAHEILTYFYIET